MEASRALAAEQAATAARRTAELEAKAAARQAAEAVAQAEAARFDAEAWALSGMLDDDRLRAIAGRVASGLATPLARSPLAVTRAVVAWCREAVERTPGPFLAAVDTALTDLCRALPGPVEVSPRLVLPPPPQGTISLRERLANILTSAAQAAGLPAS